MTNGPYRIVGVTSDDLDVVWHVAGPMLNKATKFGDSYAIDDIYAKIKDRDYQLWLVCTDTEAVAAVTTQIVIYPKSKVLAVPWIGGKDFKEWADVLRATLYPYAREYGCKDLELYARKGFERILKGKARYMFTCLREAVDGAV